MKNVEDIALTILSHVADDWEGGWTAVQSDNEVYLGGPDKEHFVITVEPNLPALAEHDARIAAEARKAALEEAARAMSGVGKHRDPCRLPDTECLCGVCDFRAEAARVVRSLAGKPDLT